MTFHGLCDHCRSTLYTRADGTPYCKICRDYGIRADPSPQRPKGPIQPAYSIRPSTGIRARKPTS